jgi:GAF domain-containing protein
VLQIISSSSGDLKPVFEAMLASAMRICEAQFGNLWLYDGDRYRVQAMQGGPPALVEQWSKGPVRWGKDTGLGRIASTKQTVHIADLTTEKAYRERDPLRVVSVDVLGARTFLAVPILKDDILVGAIVIYRQEVRPFTDKQIDLVKNFAAQAVIAIENTRLLNELRQRTDELGRSVGELRALGEVSQAVNSTLELETVLSTIVAKAVQLSETEGGAIYVFDDLQRKFHLRATFGMDQELIDALTQQHIGMDEPNVATVFAEREPLQIADLEERAPSAVNEIVMRAGFRAVLVAPLLRGEEMSASLTCPLFATSRTNVRHCARSVTCQ